MVKNKGMLSTLKVLGIAFGLILIIIISAAGLFHWTEESKFRATMTTSAGTAVAEQNFIDWYTWTRSCDYEAPLRVFNVEEVKAYMTDRGFECLDEPEKYPGRTTCHFKDSKAEYKIYLSRCGSTGVLVASFQYIPLSSEIGEQEIADAFDFLQPVCGGLSDRCDEKVYSPWLEEVLNQGEDAENLLHHHFFRLHFLDGSIHLGIQHWEHW